MTTVQVGGRCEHDKGLRGVYAQQAQMGGAWGWILTGQYKCSDCQRVQLDFVEDHPSEVVTTAGQRLSITFRI